MCFSCPAGASGPLPHATRLSELRRTVGTCLYVRRGKTWPAANRNRQTRAVPEEGERKVPFSVLPPPTRMVSAQHAIVRKQTSIVRFSILIINKKDPLLNSVFVTANVRRVPHLIWKSIYLFCNTTDGYYLPECPNTRDVENVLKNMIKGSWNTRSNGMFSIALGVRHFSMTSRGAPFIYVLFIYYYYFF